MDELYPTRRKRRRIPALDELILTILSQNTNDVNSFAAYESLKTKFPTWEKVARAKISSIANAIRVGGLADQKAPRIKAILNEVFKERGTYDIDRIKDMSMDEGMEYLLHFKGVGVKTASCVMLFSLGKPAFPVDTHILRVSRRLGIIGPKDTADKATQVYLEHTEPGDRFKFHIDIIHFGREICHSRNPECHRCKLIRSCLYYRDVLG
jgi:endonuclease-3